MDMKLSELFKKKEILTCKDINIRDPFILCEDGKYYLYGADIDREHLYLKAPSLDKHNTEYVLIRAHRKYEIYVLGDASLFFRRFEGDEVVALLEIRGPSMIDLESESGLIMIEPLENRKFLCR